VRCLALAVLRQHVAVALAFGFLEGRGLGFGICVLGLGLDFDITVGSLILPSRPWLVGVVARSLYKAPVLTACAYGARCSRDTCDKPVQFCDLATRRGS